MTCPDCYKTKLENDRLKQTITLESWKGKDHIEIRKISPDYWTVTEHRKDKESLKIHKTTKRVENVNVCNMINYIKTLTYYKIIKETKSAELVPHIIDELDLDVLNDSFGWGKNRALYYFPLYYYPIKILENLEFIDYSGRGKVTPLPKFYAYCNEINKLKQQTLF